MRKFRKKPIVIDAWRWMGDAFGFIAPADAPFVIDAATSKLEIRTLEGTMTADVGDWVIRGIKGEYYPCKPDIFAATYETAE